jgi:hypothetical protein
MKAASPPPIKDIPIMWRCPCGSVVPGHREICHVGHPRPVPEKKK